MPRICTSQSDPIDFCKKCFPDQRCATIIYGDIGDGPDDRGNCFDYEADHPPYEYEDYDCEICHKILTEKDD